MNNHEPGAWGMERDPGPGDSRPWYGKKRWLIPIGLVVVTGFFGQFADASPGKVAIGPGSGAAVSTTAAVTGAAVAGREPAAAVVEEATTAAPAVSPDRTRRAAPHRTARPAVVRPTARVVQAGAKPRPKPKPHVVKAEPKPRPTRTKKPAANCDPNYSGGCVPVDTDVDCAGGSGNGPSYFSGVAKVIGVDIYDLDRDGDGYGCES